MNEHGGRQEISADSITYSHQGQQKRTNSIRNDYNMVVTRKVYALVKHLTECSYTLDCASRPKRVVKRLFVLNCQGRERERER